MNHVVLYDTETKQWVNFRDPVEIVHAHDTNEVLSALSHIEEKIDKQGLRAAGFISYEAALAFDPAFKVVPAVDFPLLWFGLYHPPEPVDLSRVERKIKFSLGEWQPNITRDEYAVAVQRIRQYIAEGDIYQVNYSFRLKADFSGDPWGLFLKLARSQQSLHAAFVETDRFAICSASPELFFSLNGNVLSSRPMKGTACRGLTFADDKELGEWLQASEKNRSENVMIVDMVRNDIGRVAEHSSITVPKLFQVERYPTVWQMTSTVTGRTDKPVSAILSALFPCASITGAPKIRSTEIIAELESLPRKLYTGCIGTIAPKRKAQFNVAIRTVLVDKKKGEAEYGVGGGIVWGSTVDDEYNECLNKAKVLTEDRPAFSLLETMLWTPDEEYVLIDRHLRRLKNSAEYFGYPCNIKEVQKMLEDVAGKFPSVPQKVRLLVSEDGTMKVEHSAAVSGDARTIQVRLASTPVDSGNVFLYHKTNHRVVYDHARAECSACDDVLLWNGQGEITESTLANIVVETEQGFITPPVECGLLAGTFRELLLEQGKIREAKITIKELKQSKAFYLVNSVRQWQRASLIAD